MIHQFDGYCIGGYFYMRQIWVVLKHQSCQKLNHQRHQYNMLNDKIMMEMIWCKTQNKFSISSCNDFANIFVGQYRSIYRRVSPTFLILQNKKIAEQIEARIFTCILGHVFQHAV